MPQFYLKQWSSNGNDICCYDTLVPNGGVRLWRRSHIKSTACWPDLYTQERMGVDDDTIERFFGRKFESNARRVFGKVDSGRFLDPADMNVLIDYVASQMVRTPAWFRFANDLTENIFVPTAERMFQQMRSYAEEGTLKEKVREGHATARRGPFPDTPIKVAVHEETSEISVETSLGRQTALASSGIALNGAVTETLHSHNWVLLQAPFALPTSDNPVVRFGQHKDGSLCYDVGIGRANTDIIFPLNPQCLLFTEVGRDREDMARIVSNDGFWDTILRAITEGARRYIYALKPIDGIESIRPRIVDAKRNREECEAMKRWHADQSSRESEYEPELPSGSGLEGNRMGGSET